MKQIEFNQIISVPNVSVRGVFEISVVTSSSGGMQVKLLTGGLINSFLPSNLINSDGSLVSFNIGANSRWFLCIDGTLDSSGKVNNATLSMKSTRPPPIGVTKFMPPTSFSFLIYTGVGSAYVRTIGPSPILRPILMFREYSESFAGGATNYTNHYTLTFA
jgi:hypothetical protein